MEDMDPLGTRPSRRRPVHRQCALTERAGILSQCEEGDSNPVGRRASVANVQPGCNSVTCEGGRGDDAVRSALEGALEQWTGTGDLAALEAKLAATLVLVHSRSVRDDPSARAGVGPEEGVR